MKQFTLALAASLVLAPVGCSSISTRSEVTKKPPAKSAANERAKKDAVGPSAESALATGLRYERSGNDRLAYRAYSEAVQKDGSSVSRCKSRGVLIESSG